MTFSNIAQAFRLFYISLIASFFSATSASAQDTTDSSIRWWNSHFQWTVIVQEHPSFPAFYSGKNSLSADYEKRLSVTSTAFFGARLWKNAEGYFDMELGGGSGLSNALGIAGFPNGEVYRIGDPAPTIYPARLYVQQTLPFSGGPDTLDDAPNQLQKVVPDSRLVISVGKFSLTDFFDNNKYSHDPRGQFMNWSIMAMGAWDYAADTRGYTWGAVAEYFSPNFETRVAAVMVPTSANGPTFDLNIGKAFSLNAEFVKTYSLLPLPGALHIVGFLNKANMGNYREAIAQGALTAPGDSVPDITLTRGYSRVKYGGGLSIEQPLTSSLGLFARYSWNDGHTETWAFTEIDHSFLVGLQVGGEHWYRSEDKVGIAAVFNGLSDDHRDYLAHGGYGFLIGDGKLNYAAEAIYEAYYTLSLTEQITMSLDYQHVFNPAYNHDRGPIDIIAARGHFAM